MQFRGGSEVEQPKIAWRRPTLGEAFLTGCCVFTLVMLAGVLWDFGTGDSINYDKAFFQASSFGIGYFLAGLMFKSRMVWLR